MSNSARVVLKGHIGAEEVLAFVRRHYDKNASITKQTTCDYGSAIGITMPDMPDLNICLDPDGKWYSETTVISFDDGNHYTRNLFMSYDSILREDDRYVCGERFGEIIGLGCTLVDLPIDESEFAENLIMELVRQYGGWYCRDRNQCIYEFVPCRNVTVGEIAEQDRLRILSALNAMESALNNLVEQYPDVDLTFSTVANFGPFGSPLPSPDDVLAWITEVRGAIEKDS